MTMSRSVLALVEKELLVWARRTRGLCLEDAAKKLGVTLEKLEAWEAGEKPPTVSQLRKAARVYKRPLAVFYLSEPPSDFTVLKDFRQMPGTVVAPGPELMFAIRRAHELRNIAIGLAEDLGDEIPPFAIKATLSMKPAKLAAKLRERLGVSTAEQANKRDARKAFAMWREAIEQCGVFVFQFPEPPLAHNGVKLREARGFSIPEGRLPLVAVNAKDAWQGRVFTIFHELAHVALRGAGLCDLRSPHTLPPEERKVEVYCNRVAAEFLVPEEDFRSLLPAVDKQHSWQDTEIEEMAVRYSLSREVVVRRLMELDLATHAFYKQKRKEYDEERQLRDNSQTPSSDYRPNIPMLVLRSVGKNFAASVLRAMHEGTVTVSTAAGYLGVKTKYLGKIEKTVFGKSS